MVRTQHLCCPVRAAKCLLYLVYWKKKSYIRGYESHTRSYVIYCLFYFFILNVKLEKAYMDKIFTVY